ncbi:cell division protein FtsQ/DivIB [Nocardioides yefusunii]|uniref:Cell division protein FtsQ/DivIB n=1 Tax=Nocardioides yefusunii TaxID=2500546 RepID=A0ABW1QUT8_9ACTN|nr:FtsQ-type POTRA domain-containing protein [Nocardioides yefusunii]
MATDADARRERDEERMRRRFARRQWARRWGVWRPLLAAFALAVVVGLGVWVVWFSTLLGVDEVQVTGLGHLDQAQVLEVAGVKEGTPLVKVDTSNVERRVKALAPVLDVTVSRRLPGTLTLDVTEREAVAITVLAGKWNGVDADGVVFRQYAKMPRGLPRLKLVGQVDPEVLREGAQVVASLPDSLAADVRRVEVETVDHITLVMRGGRTVLWGSGEDSADKAAVLAALVKASQDTHFDVSVPGHPVTAH